MDCTNAREIILGELPDGLIRPEARAEVDVHAASCAGCRQLLRAVMVVQEELRADPAPAVPEHIWQGVQREVYGSAAGITGWLSRVRAFLPGRIVSGWEYRPVMGMAMLVVILVGAVIGPALFRHSAASGGMMEIVAAADDDIWLAEDEGWLLVEEEAAL